MVLFVYGHDFISFSVAMGLFGITFSGYTGLKSVLTSEIFGVKKLQSFMALSQLITCFGAFLVPNSLVKIAVTIGDLSFVFKSGIVCGIIR